MSIKMAGLDCEWVVRRPVALLQLAFPNKECALLRLSHIGHIPPTLADFLEDHRYCIHWFVCQHVCLSALLLPSSIIKCGVGIDRDVTYMCRGFQVQINGFVDLQHLANRYGITTNTSLAGLTRQIAGFNLKKSRHLARSNWEAVTLSTAQVNYASCDAIAAVLIMEQLVAEELAGSKAAVGWARKEFNTQYGGVEARVSSRSVLESDEGRACVYSLCQGLVNLRKPVG